MITITRTKHVCDNPECVKMFEGLTKDKVATDQALCDARKMIVELAAVIHDEYIGIVKALKMDGVVPNDLIGPAAAKGLMLSALFKKAADQIPKEFVDKLQQDMGPCDCTACKAKEQAQASKPERN